MSWIVFGASGGDENAQKGKNGKNRKVCRGEAARSGPGTIRSGLGTLEAPLGQLGAVCVACYVLKTA